MNIEKRGQECPPHTSFEGIEYGGYQSKED
jgi:hypothetical protein